MRINVDLPPPLGPITPTRAAGLDVEVEAREDRPRAERLDDAAQLQEELPYSQSRISKQLAILRQAGVASTRREGTCVYYSVDEEALEIAREFIDALERSLHTPHEADYCPPER